MAREGNRLRSAAMRKALYDRDIAPKLGTRNIHELTRRDIEQIYKEKALTSLAQATIIKALLKRVINWSLTRADLARPFDANLAKWLCPLPRLPSRQRYLNDTELSSLLDTVSEDKKSFPSAVYFIIHTGVRRMEAFGASWGEINFEKKVWIIPGSRTKTGVPHTVPLPAKLFEWVCQRRVDQGLLAHWLFPGRSDDQYFKGYSTALKNLQFEVNQSRFIDPLAREPWTLHDLRRTFATGLTVLLDENERSRVPTQIIERLLNHKPQGVSAIYNRYEYLREKRNALCLWEDYLINLRLSKKASGS